MTNVDDFQEVIRKVFAGSRVVSGGFHRELLRRIRTLEKVPHK